MSALPDLKGTSLSSAPTIPQGRLFIALYGVDKAGKTDWALRSTPGPHCYLAFDQGHRGVIEKFEEKYGAITKGFYHPMTPTHLPLDAKEQESMAKVWDQFVTDYRFALRNFRTVIVDTATEAWEVLRLARFGKLMQIWPRELYTPVNYAFKSEIRRALDDDVTANVILLHKAKPEYGKVKKMVGGKVVEDEQKTGKFEMEGFNQTGFIVEVVAETMFDEKASAFKLVIRKCRHNYQLRGVELPGEVEGEWYGNSFRDVARLVMPEVPAEAWR